MSFIIHHFTCPPNVMCVCGRHTVNRKSDVDSMSHMPTCFKRMAERDNANLCACLGWNVVLAGTTSGSDDVWRGPAPNWWGYQRNGLSNRDLIQRKKAARGREARHGAWRQRSDRAPTPLIHAHVREPIAHIANKGATSGRTPRCFAWGRIVIPQCPKRNTEPPWAEPPRAHVRRKW